MGRFCKGAQIEAWRLFAISFGGDESDDDKRHKTKNKRREAASFHKSNSPHFRKTRNSSGTDQAVKTREMRTEDATKNDGRFDSRAKNPYFIVKVKSHHRSFMVIPRQFAKKTKLDEVHDVVLRHEEDKKAWPAKIVARTYGRIDLADGWSKFCKNYEVKVGETWRFTLYKRGGNFIINFGIVKPISN
ncbi:OLC1v1030908C1 [Oldenlandia corymbosa var. corymbosa]|uniref:OLC1v1030908C1 n=1 Tax=Oldenlandia corymbosa var. corymbosa TaxID=529605 RepID=A0AAV1CH48_OLDCO|nr:OLC1v1030908C1 [Oldenlandia corymbosa var. corymbosa]